MWIPVFGQRRASDFRRKISCLLLFSLAASTAIGCATHSHRLRRVRTAYFAGELKQADDLLQADVKKRDRDIDVLHLDRAMVKLAMGQTRDAEQLLRRVRDRFDFLEQQNALESLASLAADDQKLAYAGEDYEKILVRVMLTLCSLLGDGQDALAYSHQVTQKQEQIIHAGSPGSPDNLQLQYKRVAIGPYLHGMLRETRYDQYDAAARAYQKVVQWAPEFPFGPVDLARVQHGRHSKAGHGVVYVFALVGRGPYKEETISEPTGTALLIADRILSATGKYTLPPTIAPVRVPIIKRPLNEIDGVIVGVDESPAGKTATIADISKMAVEQHQAVYPRLVARAVVRRIVKKAVVVAGKDALNVSHPLANLAMDVSGVAWEATESADTRCWGLLPDRIQVLRIELPIGQHDLRLTPARGNQPTGSEADVQVSIREGRNTYVLAHFPDRRLAGQILVR